MIIKAFSILAGVAIIISGCIFFTVAFREAKREKDNLWAAGIVVFATIFFLGGLLLILMPFLG